MEYRILKERYNQTSHNIRIVFIPENEILNVFFSALRINKIPDLLNKISNSENYYQEFMSLRFYKGLDWEDLEELSVIGGIKEGEIVIYHEIYGETIIEECLLIQLVLDYSRKLLEVYEKDTSLSDAWKAQIIQEIIQLESVKKAKCKP